MKIATFNVNSLKMRLAAVGDWLRDQAPDVLMLQELKGTEVPVAELAAAGYTVQAVTQKAYNGVATLTRTPATVAQSHLLAEDEQARYLEVDYAGIRLINIYAPNGNPIDTDKFIYKLNWLNGIFDRLSELRDARIPFLIAGDFNIIPDMMDAAQPTDWTNDALFSPQARAMWRAFRYLGLTDAVRDLHPQVPGLYSFWDYQAGAWPRNNGIRIDHILLSPSLADKLTAAGIDRTPRGLEKPSDHTPVWAEIAL